MSDRLSRFDNDHARQNRVRLLFAAIAVLWILVWGGYNTGIGILLAPGFPASRMQLFQGIRCLFPILAAWLALLAMLAHGSIKVRAVAGPLGLLGFFAAVGIVSSGLISRVPLRAMYWGAMFESVVIVLVAVCSSSEALPLLSRLMSLNWFIDIVFMIAILGSIPLLGAVAIAPTRGSPLGIIVLHGSTTINGRLFGMATSRNTGLARYAGVAAIVALARILKGKRWTRFVWMGILLAALYTFLLAQARTETFAFLAGSLVILLLRKRRRTVMFGFGVLGVTLLSLVGFFQNLWNFLTRDHNFDPTFSGRTDQWTQGLAVTRQSLWVGFGFQADRYYLHGIQLENAFFHALIQAGILGTLAYVAAYALAWFLVIRLYISPHSSRLPDEIPGILMFFTVFSIAESIAYYSAAFMLLAPVLAYIQVFTWQQKALAVRPGYVRQPAFSLENRSVARRRINPEKGPAFTGPPCQTDG